MNSTPTPSSNQTVFVVDDDPDMRQSLHGLIRALGYSVRVFSSAAEFHAEYQPQQTGCLILDVRMPRQSGLELYEQLLREKKRLPVIFITAHADVSTAVAAMKTGAIEFLEKPFDAQKLHNRIEKALKLDASWRASELEYARRDELISRLTHREQETLELILAGETNKAMAARLFISDRAVELRRAAIMRKLKVRSFAELLDVAITHRLLSDLRGVAHHPPFFEK
jgi:two-component system, LuxR family, response regulator FixJ